MFKINNKDTNTTFNVVNFEHIWVFPLLNWYVLVGYVATFTLTLTVEVYSLKSFDKFCYDTRTIKVNTFHTTGPFLYTRKHKKISGFCF